MKHYEITHSKNQEILFSGTYRSFKDCLEDAILIRTDLDHANFGNQNLCNAELDGSRLRHCDFSGANLTGANLSECDLKSADFSKCDLYNTCLAYSDTSCANFKYANFGATEIVGSKLDETEFSSLSCFDLKFFQTESMNNCTYTTIDGTKYNMNNPPVIIKGLSNSPIVFLDDVVIHMEKAICQSNLLTFLKHKNKKQFIPL